MASTSAEPAAGPVRPPLRLLLVDDHAVVRAGYRRLLDAEPDFVVCAEAASAEEACAQALQCEPDLAVVDLNLGPSSGLEAIRRMRARRPALRVLVFTMYDTPAHAMQALRAGAQSYLTKSCDPQEMVDALRRTAVGECVLAAEVAGALAAARSGEAEQRLGMLTPREFEVLRLVVQGLPVAEVAERLHLSAKTVHNQMSSVRGKLAVDNDLQLLQLAVRHGLIELAPRFAPPA